MRPGARTKTRQRRRGSEYHHGGDSTPSKRVAASAPDTAGATAILVVDDIVKRFETPDGILTAVDHVSFTVAPGEFVR